MKFLSPALLMSFSSDPTTNYETTNSNFLTNQNRSENSRFVIPELVAGSNENDKKN